jgi:hypothetical protein
VLYFTETRSIKEVDVQPRLEKPIIESSSGSPSMLGEERYKLSNRRQQCTPG